VTAPGSGAGAGAESRPGPTGPRDATIGYPGGLRARWRWAGSGQAAAVFALTEAGGTLEDLGPLVSEAPDELCRAELRIDGPAGAWTVRLASTIHDEPAGLAWDDAGLLVVKYGFHTYGLEARTGAARWTHRSATPLIAVLGSPRLRHVVVQSEIETFAIEPDGEVVWRIAHSDVVAEADLVGGRLVLTSFTGAISAIDPATGRETG
jgi:PQQ-like domain